jgi:hypothetical protein
VIPVTKATLRSDDIVNGGYGLEKREKLGNEQVMLELALCAVQKEIWMYR